jgi:flagellar motor protein MotB
MGFISRTGISGMLLALAALAVGCCDKENKQIEELTKQNLELSNKSKDLSGQLATARTRESQLMAQMDSKDLAMTALQTENQELAKGKAAATGAAAGKHTAKTSEAGGETTVYTESVGSDVLFEPGKATLTAGGVTKLDHIIATLKSRYAGMTVRVYGYTDADPIRKTRNLWTDNLDLSANRAMAVTRHLREKGINAEHIETVAMGETHPVAPNSSSANKARNRRVDIVVVKK